jgi:hypothetical protein
MLERMTRALQGDIQLYEEVEHNTALTQEAYQIVGAVAAISAIAALLTGFALPGVNPITNAILSGVNVLIGYLLWSYLTFYIGVNVFKGTATYGELQRTLGYAYTPVLGVQILLLLGRVIPLIGCLFVLLALPVIGWAIYLGFIAVRQALDVDNQTALLTAGIALVPYILISLLINSIL